MAEKPKQRVEIRDFPGLIIDTDPHDLPPGAAADQRNAVSTDQGQLKSRLGYRKVCFEDD